MTDKIQKPGGVLVRKSTGLSALRDQVEGAKQAMIPPDESLVLVLDVSPSMGEPVDRVLDGPMKIDSMREAAMTLITRCSQGRSQVGIVEFGGYAKTHEAMGTDLRKVGESIPRIAGGRSDASNYYASGFISGTNLVSGLAQAWLGMLSDKDTKVKRIVLMTDGEDNSLYGGVEPNLGELPKYQEIFRTKNVIVDCIAFGASADRALLAKIAGTTGVVKEAKNAEELVKAFAQLEAGARGLLPRGT